MEAQSNSMDAMTEQGFAHLQAGRFEDAVDSLTACLAVYPDAPKALLGRAMARLKLKEVKSAEQDFRRASELDPKEPESRIGLGMTLAVQNQIYPAYEVLEKLIADFPNFVRGYIQLGMIQIKIGTIAKGRETLKQALQHRPTLEERNFIESNLKEQEKLDVKRFYRPDFEALRKQQKSSES